MSEYCFGVKITHGKQPMSTKEHMRLDRMAEEIGGSKRCGHAMIHERDGKWKSWFYIPNRGEPFNRELAEKIMREVSK